MSPDQASNFRAAQMVGLVGENPEADYVDILAKIRRKEIENVLVLGDRAIAPEDLDAALLEGLSAAKVSVGVLTEADTAISKVLKHVVPGRSILEKSGLLVNRKNRMQYAQQVVPFPDGTLPEWRFLAVLAEVCGFKLLSGAPLQMSDRDVTRWYLSADPVIASLGLSIATIKNNAGVQVPLAPTSGGAAAGSSVTEGAHSAA